MDIGIPEMILIGIVLVVFFGPKKLPELGGSIGKAIKEFKNTLSSSSEPEPAETKKTPEHTEAETTTSR